MRSDRRVAGFLHRLRHDRRGNVLAMMAAFMVPLMAFAGCAIDSARLYVVRVRLQQSCDAGVLAGRRAMTDVSTTNTTLEPAAVAQAQSFFTNNFRTGWFSTADAVFTPAKTSEAQVSGTASVTVPMTVMKMFGIASKPINVTCEASYDVADTDIIFVLDTTGSMACAPADSDSTCNDYVSGQTATSYQRPTDSAGGNDSMAGYPGTTGYYIPEKSNSRIAALRSAVLNFYDTMAANIDPTTHIRYGFVTYTSTVNAGKAVTQLSPTYMVGGAGNATTTWNYQTRRLTGDYSISSSTSNPALGQSACTSTTSRTPAATGAQPYVYDPSSGTATITTRAWSTANGGKCVLTTQTVGPVWSYAQYPLDVAAYVAGGTVADPTKVTGDTSRWEGCLEERDTTSGATSFNVDSLPNDLDPDLIPSSDASRWRPMWADAIYARYNYNSTATASSNGDSNNHSNVGADAFLKAGIVSCGKPVKRLGTLTRAQVSTYVNAADFKPMGGTYHDTGMIWGTRMLAPGGIFAADTGAWPGRLSPNRVIVFLTDGDMAPTPYAYGMYGVEYYDRRVTNGNLSNIKAYHNARFLAECAAAKALNIDVWTVSIAPAATSEMRSCATTTAQALYTSDGSGLANAFAVIAKQVAMLRISK